jgi:YbbR domain-containing protein
VDQITQAIVEVDLTDRTASFSESYRYTLCNDNNEPVDAKSVETNAAEVNLTLYIQRVMEVPLLVTVVAGGGATEETSDIKIEPEVIKVAGSEAHLEQLAEGLILGEILLADLKGDSTLQMEIVLPEGLENLSGQAEATVNVKFPELDVRNFKISSSNFEAINVPEGLEVTFLNDEIVVTIRGPKALVAKMTASDILITVDFTDAVVGSVTEKANVIMGEGYTAAGAMGTYRVFANVQELVPEETQ